MPTTQSIQEYLLEILSPAGALRTKKMFGGVGIYCNDIFIGMLNDDKLFLKAIPSLQRLIRYDGVPPYVGGSNKYWHVQEVYWDDRPLMISLVKASLESA